MRKRSSRCFDDMSIYGSKGRGRFRSPSSSARSRSPKHSTSKCGASPVALSQEQPRSIPVGLLVESLNELIDLHEKRVSFGLRYRVVAGVWLTLYFIGFIAMTVVGVHARLVGDRNLRVSLLLALGLSAALTVTIDLDRPQQTLFGVNQDALMELKERLDNAASAAN